MVLRRAWKAGWWCTRQGARLGLWTTWLLLLAVAAGQIYFLSSRRIPVPKPLAQYVERHLATRGLHLSYARGLMDFTGRILLEGVRIASTSAPADPLASVRTLASETAALLGFAFETGEIALREDFLGEGYGIVGEAERRAIRLVARAEGILLDPVYTGRAFAALLSMIHAGEFRKGQSVLFWHSGGSPALFPYAGDLVSP